jgi:hypothetical protein
VSATHREHHEGQPPHRRLVSSIGACKSIASRALVVTGLSTLMLGGCFAPEHGVNDLEPGQEPGGVLVDAPKGGGDSGTGCVAPTLSSLHVRVRTTAYGGRYAPRNIGAIWVEDSTGKFIHTIERWAGTRARWLLRWQTSSKANAVDAITSATLSSHTTHDRTWNLAGADKCQIAAGNYKLVIETTDYNGMGATTEIPFTKGSSAVTLMPAETTNFHDLLLELK